MTIFQNVKYVDIKYIKKIVFEMAKCSNYEELKDFVNYAHVRITKKEAKEYHDRFIPKYNGNNFIYKILNNELYKFDTFTIDYFINYIDNLKIKLNKFFDLLDNIELKDKDTLLNYDIKLNKDGLLKSKDAERIIYPLLYCLSLFSKKIMEANNIETYRDFNISRDLLYASGLNELDLYPYINLQVSDFSLNLSDEFIPYTEKQKERIRQKNKNEYLINEIMNTYIDNKELIILNKEHNKTKIKDKIS